MPDAYDFWAAQTPRDDLDAIDAFWDRFLDLAPRIERYLAGEVPDFDAEGMGRGALGRLAKRLTCVFQTDPEAGPCVVVSPELNHAMRPLARAVVQRAPRLGAWTALDARPPVPEPSAAAAQILERSRSAEMAVEEIEPRRGAHRLVDLAGSGRSDGEFIAGQSGVVFSVLLGEAMDRDWLGETTARIKPAPPLSERLTSLVRPAARDVTWLARFRNEAEDIVRSFEDERPTVPFSELPMTVEEFSTVRLSPRAPDRARRRDATLYQTRYRVLTATRLAGERVTAPRFTRFGEAFVGVKISLVPPTTLNDPAELVSLGSRLEERLMETRTGGVVARAVGLEHVYVDLALTDLAKALPEIRGSLDREGVRSPAWLIFDEAGLEDRYVPLTPHTPPTPLV